MPSLSIDEAAQMVFCSQGIPWAAGQAITDPDWRARFAALWAGTTMVAGGRELFAQLWNQYEAERGKATMDDDE